MRLTRRRFGATGASLLTAALAAPSIAQPVSTLRYIPISDLTGIDPIWTTSTAVRNHGYLVYDTLFGTDASYAVQPQMAQGSETTQDGRMVTIRLREGLRFHDKSPVLARDCVASAGVPRTGSAR